jgi:thioredoxin-like negative regulator of GroEL
MTLEELNQMIEEKPAVMIYFSGENCGVCKALQPKIKNLFDQSFDKIEQIYLDVAQYKHIAVAFNIFSIPTMLVFLDGKEFIRKGRNLSIELLKEQLQRPYDIFLG